MSEQAFRAKGSAGSRSEPASADRGVRLDSLEAVLRATASTKEWRSFVEGAGLSPIPGSEKSKGKADYSSYFYASPASADGSLYLYGDLRPVPGKLTDAHLKLRWEQRPDSPTPQRIKSSSRAVGGWQKVLQRIATSWPGGGTASVEVTATFLINRAAYQPLKGLELKSKPLRAGVRQLTQTAAAWAIDPPSGPVQRLSVARLRTTQLVIVASGQHTLPLSRDIEAELERAVWEGVRVFLEAL